MASLDKQAPVLITGGTGFAGSHLLELLKTEGFTNLHLTSLPTSNAQPEADHTTHYLDLTDLTSVINLFKKIKPQYIYHLAAIATVGSSFEQAATIITNNTLLQLNVLEAMRLETPTARLLSVGSAQEYDLIASLPPTSGVTESQPLGPANPYGVSKVTQDLLALSYVYSYDLDIVRARPFNHIGERQTSHFAIASFAKQIAEIEAGQRDHLEVGNLDAIRDFTDVKDVVSAYFTLMHAAETGSVYNIGSGKGYTIQEVLNQLIALAKTEVKVVTNPDKQRQNDIPSIVADCSKLHQLGWRSTHSLSETLSRILQYWRQTV